MWLNGPGLRWLAPLAAQHFLAKAGLQGSMRIEGSLSGGISITDVNVRGTGTLANLTLGRATPHYQWSHLLRGKLDGLSVDGLHADLRLGLTEKAKAESNEEPPPDLDKILQTLRGVRNQVLPVQLDLKDISLNATRDGKPVFTLEPSRIFHATGSDEIQLEIGRITDPTGRDYQAQSTRLTWAEHSLTIDRLDPLPGFGVRDLELQLPAAGGPALATQIHLDDAVLELQSTAGLATAKLTLKSGSVDIARTLKPFGIDLTNTNAKLSALALDAANILPDPRAVTGRADITLQAATYQDWEIPQAVIGSEVESGRATVKLDAQVLGAPFSLDWAIALDRGDHKFTPGDAKGSFHLANIPELLDQLATHVKAIKPDTGVPPSTLDGSFTLAFANNKLQTADIDANLAPADPALASPLALHARWLPDKPASANLTLDGLKLTATYDLKAKSYEGDLALDKFSSPRIDRWLAIAGIKPGGIAELTGHWQGGGELSNKKHHGKLSLTHGTWQQADNPPITAAATVHYAWPEHVAVSDLTAQRGQQTLTLEQVQTNWRQAENQAPEAATAANHLLPDRLTARGVKLEAENQTVTFEADLTDNLLKLDRLLWRDGETEIAEGSASLPVPPDFSQWRHTLATDTRLAALTLQSRKLSLGLLKPWLPALDQLDPRATGELHINLSGNYAEPTIHATLECLNLKSPANPKLPPAALKLALNTAAGHLKLDGSVTAPDYPPAILTASLPFHPAAWADEPGAIQQEILTARAELPRLDLSRFTTLLPAARQLGGIVTGNLEAAGKLSAPELRGTVRLANGGIVFTDPKLPPVQAASADIDLTLAAVTLKSLRATIAGGTLDGGGTLNLTNGKPASIDFRLRGDHLPLLRNDLLILRANLDLRLQGPWETAALTGTAGAVDSLFYRDIELLPIGRPFTSPSAAALPKIDAPKSRAESLPAPFGNWTINLTARTQEPFLIRGNLATGRVDASLRVGGTLADPKPDGTVVLSDFVAALPFSTLKVKQGTVRFTPESGFDPVLEIRGTAEPRPYRIDVYAYGKASDPQLVLTSNPPLPDNEIMTLLATGTTSAGLENTQAASSRAIQLFAEEVRRGRVRYSRQLRPLLGLFDRVDFTLAESDPYSSGSLSTATINLTDSWLLSAGMGAEGNTRVMGIWRVSFK